MKIKNLLATAFLLVTLSSYSQTLSFGPRLGANFTTYGGMDNATFKPGLLAGVFLVYSKREHAGFGADLLYSGEGAKYKITTTNGTTTVVNEYNTRLNYIRLPLHFIYFFNEAGDKFRPKVAIGPSLGYLASTKQKLKTTTRTNSNETSFDTESTSLNNYKSMDVGLSLGLGFNYKILSRTWLNMDARYYYGLLDITKNNTTSDRVNNHGPSISFGIGLGIDKAK